jgi:hypothetical protein
LRRFVASALFVACVLGPACGPPRETRDEPAPPPEEIEVDFDGGSLRVRRGECDDVDVTAVRDWANRAHRDLSEAWPDRTERFRVDGLVMVGMREPVASGEPAQGYWDRKRRRVVYRCGIEIVIRHELFHVWCDRAELPCDCTWIDHPDGYDLDCSPQGS